MDADQIPRYGTQNSRVPKKPQGPRRILSTLEEQTLIVCLHELVANGWKADNGFKAGYLQALESAMNARLPDSKIGVRHINSKLTVWKKHYYLLVAMLGTSGFGWNDSAKVIEVNDDIWEEYVKANKEVCNMRTKSWRYYDDWCELFGKDRANGNDAAGFVDVVEDILLNDSSSLDVNGKGKEIVNDYCVSDYGWGSPCIDLTPHSTDYGTNPKIPSMEKFGLNTVENEKKNPLKLKKERKRKTPETTTLPSYAPFLSTFIADANDAFGSFASKIQKEEPTDDEIAAKILAAIETVSGINEEDMNILCFKLIDNPKHASLFLRSSPRNREIQANLILKGKMN